MSENTGKSLTKTELIADLKAMSLEISALCGANQGIQSDSGFIDENRNDSEKEIISDISGMLTEMNDILDRMTAGKNNNSYLEDEQAQSLRRPVLQALDISEQMIELESLTTECGCQQLLEKCNIS